MTKTVNVQTYNFKFINKIRCSGVKLYQKVSKKIKFHKQTKKVFKNILNHPINESIVTIEDFEIRYMSQI